MTESTSSRSSCWLNSGPSAEAKDSWGWMLLDLWSSKLAELMSSSRYSLFSQSTGLVVDLQGAGAQLLEALVLPCVLHRQEQAGQDPFNTTFYATCGC